MLKINGSGVINCGTSEKPNMRPVAFTFSSVAEFCQMQGNGSIRVLQDYLNQAVAGEVNLLALRDLLYCALKYGAKKAGQVFAETPDTVGEILGGMEAEAIVALNEILGQSMPKPAKQPASQSVEEAKKKEGPATEPEPEPEPVFPTRKEE